MVWVPVSSWWPWQRTATGAVASCPAAKAGGGRPRAERASLPPSFGWQHATEGFTNGQNGERLFGSGRILETHLSHAYAKLGLATRAQLAAEVAQRE